MDVASLKEYIYNENKIEYILENIGCHSIEYHPNKEYYSCGNIPNKDGDGDNKVAINVKNNKYLNLKNYTREKYFDDTSDLISLVEYNKNIKFQEAMKYIHEILGLKFTYKKEQKKEEKIDPLQIFKKVKSRRKLVDISDFKVLDEAVLYDFVPYIHISWIREGITQRTVDKFGLGYSYYQKRIIIPLRYWLTGELLGTNARTTVENFDLLGIKKYFITPSYPKNINLFGLWEHKDEIQKLGYVIVYESEKNVLKRDSLLDYSGVALSGHTMSDEQIRILIGLNVDIIISMDNDVSINEVRHLCSKFYGIRNVYYTWDKYDLLDEKDSITDKPNKIFEYFIKYKVKYDSKEHNEYLKSLERK